MKQFKIIGLMSGTSLDGLDIVYVNFYQDKNWKYEIINSKNVELIKVTKQDLNTANDAMKKLRNGDVDGRIVLEP